MNIVSTKCAYHFDKFRQDLIRLQNQYQFIVNTIGHSRLGKPIYEIKLGSGSKKIHLNGAFHANEWITSLVLMKWLEEFLQFQISGEINSDFAKINLQDCTISIVPMVNPDGVDLVITQDVPATWLQYCQTINGGSNDFSTWKANIQGVDLNNQFPANWEIEKARKLPKSFAPRDFPGISPLSEPEARALAQLTEKENFDRVFAFHTQGKEIYWGYENFHPLPESKILAEQFAKLSGYKPIEIIDSHAGFRDWFIYQFRKPGFTIELGLGENPLPLTQFNEIYDDVRNMITAAIYL